MKSADESAARHQNHWSYWWAATAFEPCPQFRYAISGDLFLCGACGHNKDDHDKRTEQA